MSVNYSRYNRKLRIFEDYLLVFLLIATSGFEYFYANELWILLGFIIAIYIANKRGLLKKVNTLFLLIVVLFPLWETIQFFILGGFRIRPLIGTFVRLTFAYLVIKNTNFKFLTYYINILVFFAVISIVFYILFYLIPSFIKELIVFGDTHFTPIKREPGLYIFNKPNIILFSFHGFEYFPMRNSGPFWEPGAFAVFLTIALVFNLLINDISIFSKKNIILITAILTTISTSGYLILFLIIIYVFYRKGQKSFIILLFLPLIIYIAYYYIKELDFLYSKIETNIELADVTTGSRFGSALADIKQFVANPILGYGRNIYAQYGTEEFDIGLMHRNNGATRIFVQWGVLAIFYLFNVYKGFNKISSLYDNKLFIPGYFILIVLMLNAFSQSIFQYPFFYGLMFLQLINNQLYCHQTQ